MAKEYKDLHELDSYELENSEQDLRGNALYTFDGKRLVDPERNHVAALVLEDHRFVPVSEVEIRDGDAYIDPVDADGFGVVPPRKREVSRGRVLVHPRT